MSRRKMSAPDRSYGWYKAHCFNDYMERVIGTFLITTFLILFIIIIILLIIITIRIRILVTSLAGEYGSELEQMGFNDESRNTDYLDCVKFCADLVWHGGLFNQNLNVEDLVF